MYIPVLQERDAAATTTVSAGEGDEAGPLGLSIPSESPFSTAYSAFPSPIPHATVHLAAAHLLLQRLLTTHSMDSHRSPDSLPPPPAPPLPPPAPRTRLPWPRLAQKQSQMRHLHTPHPPHRSAPLIRQLLSLQRSGLVWLCVAKIHPLELPLRSPRANGATQARIGGSAG